MSAENNGWSVGIYPQDRSDQENKTGTQCKKKTL
jgi:hypothetical protein